MTKIIFVGVDGEMTGTELNEGAKLCQIGFAFSPRTTFVSDIGWTQGEYVASAEALAVNKFTIGRIQRGPAPEFVDELATSFLQVNGGLEDKKILIPVGFNVGSFDMPFVKDALPNSYRYFSRRTVDLNAVCFAMGGNIKYEGSVPKWNGWKRLAKDYAKNKIDSLGIPGEAHDAGWDAIEAILCLEFLKSVTNNGVTDDI